MGQDIAFSFSFTGSKADLLDSLESARKHLSELVSGIIIYPLHHGIIPKNMNVDKLRFSETPEHKFSNDEYEILLRATVDESIRNMVNMPMNASPGERKRLVAEKKKTEYHLKEYAGFTVHLDSEEKRDEMLVVFLHRSAGTNKWTGKTSMRPSHAKRFNKTWTNIAKTLAVVASIIPTTLDLDDYGGLEHDIKNACIDLKRSKCI
jgi:hypothetical protein